MRLVEQWQRLVDGLPEGWTAVRVVLTAVDERRAARIAGLLAPLYAGRMGTEVRFTCGRTGQGARPDTVRRLLRGVDREGLTGTLEASDVLGARLDDEEERALADDPVARRSLGATWAAEVEGLPPDWSDVYAEVVLRSSDQLARAALLMAPTNPLRVGESGDEVVLRFRCAREFGYGASPAMVRRCLERLDASRIHGDVRILRALSHTEPNATQGPVWYIGGRSV